MWWQTLFHSTETRSEPLLAQAGGWFFASLGRVPRVPRVVRAVPAALGIYLAVQKQVILLPRDCSIRSTVPLQVTLIFCQEQL